MALAVDDASLEDLARASLDSHLDPPRSFNGDCEDEMITPKMSQMRLKGLSAVGSGSSSLGLSLTLTEKLGRAKSDEFEKLKQRLIDRGKLYEDPHFPANGEWNGLGAKNTSLC